MNDLALLELPLTGPQVRKALLDLGNALSKHVGRSMDNPDLTKSLEHRSEFFKQCDELLVALNLLDASGFLLSKN